jgi:hypothetical protein
MTRAEHFAHFNAQVLRRPSHATDEAYGSAPLDELTQADTKPIPVGQEVFSEDFTEEPTVAEEGGK